MTTTTGERAARVRVWIDACRPRTLPAAAAPVVVGAALAAHDGVFAAVPALLALVGALLLQIAANLANDYYDDVKGADGPDRLGPVRATAAGLVSRAAMRRAFIGVLVASTIVGAALVAIGGWPILAIGVAGLLCAVLYTGGPFPLAYLGLGEIFVFVFFGPIAVAGTYFVQAHDAPLSIIVAGVAPGLLSAAVLMVNNLRDVESDARAAKKTLVVRFGRAFVRALYVLSIVGAGLSVIPLVPRFGFGVLAALVATVLGLALARHVVREDGRALNPRLGQTARLLVVHALAMAIVVLGR